MFVKLFLEITKYYKVNIITVYTWKSQYDVINPKKGLLFGLWKTKLQEIQESIIPQGLGTRGVQTGLFASKHSALSGNLHSLLSFWKIKHPPLNHNLRVREVTTNHAHPPPLAQEGKALCATRVNMSSTETISNPWISFLKKPQSVLAIHLPRPSHLATTSSALAPTRQLLVETAATTKVIAGPGQPAGSVIHKQINPGILF